MLTGEQIGRVEAWLRESEGSVTAHLPRADALALLQLARAVSDGPRGVVGMVKTGPHTSQCVVKIPVSKQIEWDDGQTVALVPVPVKEG